MKIKKYLLIFSFLAVLFLSSLQATEWTSPVDVSASTLELDQGHVALDANGNAFAVWVQGNGTTNVVTVSRFNAVTALWETPVTLSDNNSYLPQLSVSPDGNAIVIWQHQDSDLEYLKVEYAAYNNGSWTTAAKIDSTHPDDENEILPSVSINNVGTALAVWQAGGEPGNVIRAGKYDFATDTWSQIQDLSSVGVNSRERAMVSSNTQGTAIAVWEIRDTINNEFRIESSKYYSGSWHSVEIVATSSTLHQLNPDVAIDNIGNACVTWSEWDPSTYAFSINVANRTSSWSLPEVLADSGYIASSDLNKIAVIRLDNSGNAVALWVIFDSLEATASIQSKVFQEGSWSNTAITLSATCNLSFNPQLTVNGSGDAFAVWTTISDSSIKNIYASKYNKENNSWEFPEVISEPGESSERPEIASNSRGDYIAIWFKTADFSSGVLQATRTSTLYPVLPPESISGYQEIHYYVVDIDRVNIINWEASPSLNIGAYLVFRDNTLIAILPNTAVSFEDHNRLENVSNTYKVYAMDLNGSNSNPVTITLP